MRKRIFDVVEVPKDIHVTIDGHLLKLTRAGNIVEKELSYPAKHEGDKLIISHEKPTKNVKKLIKSSTAHIRNMIRGLENKYVYKMQICAVHFPMTVAIKGQELIIKNFLGEVKERKAKILPGVNLKIEKEIIFIESHDKEKAGQTAANIETATTINNRDRRVFQDGIYITEKHKGARIK